MANYIEREDDNLSPNDTVVDNLDNKEDLEFISRWNWILKWDEMTIAEKIQLFVPYLHYINLRDIKKSDFDTELNKNINENAFKLCRFFGGMFKFDPDQQGIPNMIIIYSPVDVNNIPYPDIKQKVIEWGNKYCSYWEHVEREDDSDIVQECCCCSKIPS